MFTFEDLLTVPAESIREFVSAADKKVLALALKGGRNDVKAHLFKAMSSRAVEMMKEDMEVMGPVRLKNAEEAQQKIINVVRQLEEQGEIVVARGGDEGAMV